MSRYLRAAVLCGLLAGLLPAQVAAAKVRTTAQHQAATHQVAKSAPSAARKALHAGRPAPRRQSAAHSKQRQHPAATSGRRDPGAPTERPGTAAARARPLIVIDAGHGGRDPGAIGVSGTQEKTVTLAAALELRRALEATGRYRVALTRSTDRTLSLEDRLVFARRHDADLLIAIHADASPDRAARGASVYVGSPSVATRVPADRESPRAVAGRLSPLEPVPAESSAFLQYSMIEQLSDDIRMVATPARNAHLYVLGTRGMPSVLLEMGFLSNRQDEAQLRQPAHRAVIIRAIGDALDDYFTAIKRLSPRT